MCLLRGMDCIFNIIRDKFGLGTLWALCESGTGRFDGWRWLAGGVMAQLMSGKSRRNMAQCCQNK